MSETVRTAIEVAVVLALAVWAVSGVFHKGGKIGAVAVLCAVAALLVVYGVGRLAGYVTLSLS